MLGVFATAKDIGGETPVLLHAVQPKDLERFLAARAPAEQRWLSATGFAAKDGELQFIPGDDGRLQAAVLGLGAGRDPHALAAFSERLPPGTLRARRRAGRLRRRPRGLCLGHRHRCL